MEIISSIKKWYSQSNNFADTDIIGTLWKCIFVENSCAIQECKDGRFVNSGCNEIQERCHQVMEQQEVSEAKKRACVCCALSSQVQGLDKY